MRVGRCGAEGGRREEEEKLQAWRAREDTAQPSPQLSPVTAFCRDMAKSSAFSVHPNSGPAWTHVLVFPFSLSLKALDTMDFPSFLATPVLLVLLCRHT